jgi:hypothetical protein
MAIIREVTGRSGLSAIKLPELSALELEKHVSVPEAAAIKGISPDTFKRHYSHLIRKQSPRRNSVKLRDLIEAEERVA